MGLLVVVSRGCQIIGLALIAIALAATHARADMPSPGPLGNGHASIDNDADCQKCHDSGKHVAAQLCLDCHKDLNAEMAASRGLHGRNYKAQACEDCHVEHAGRGGRLVKWPGGSMDKLDHKQTGWPLEGAHTGVSCLNCHTKTTKLGKQNFLATSAACGSCHKDFHGGRFANDCKKCHALTDWKTLDLKTFDHKLAKFQLTGKHVGVECAKCHGTPSKWAPISFVTCEGCHPDPHDGQFRPKVCTACHDTKSWTAAADAVKGNHPVVSLAAGHAKVACKTCHDRGNDKPPTKGSTCVSCHPPVHQAKFGTKCEGCHGAIRWIGIADSIARTAHSKTPYPLAGKHATVECGRCHLKSRPENDRYRKVAFAQCGPCHEDKHKGEFKATAGGECGGCHTVNGFAPTTFGVSQHATTGFTLDGKHAATPCSGCHKGSRPRLGWQVGQTECLDCHENPHGTQFAKEMVAGGCAHCHTAGSWHAPRIDHSTWPLLGAHARTTCGACHGEQKQGAEPAAYRGIPRECEGCHDDTHAGQFRQTDPVKACKACHEAETWKLPKFDHGKTRYPLEGAHLKLTCEQCHGQAELRNGETAVRWRLGYIKCKDCHANPHVEKP